MLQETIRTSLVVEGDGEGGSRPHDLPRGWQVMQDEEGKEYYWHIASGKTQYARPVVEKEKDPKKISILVSTLHMLLLCSVSLQYTPETAGVAHLVCFSKSFNVGLKFV